MKTTMFFAGVLVGLLIAGLLGVDLTLSSPRAGTHQAHGFPAHGLLDDDPERDPEEVRDWWEEVQDSRTDLYWGWLW